jgi:putative pyruvate formate lyase activating enzyme
MNTAALLRSCRVCPNACGVDRLSGERGRCGIGAEVTVASASLHFGEEPQLVGAGGSGTIFLSGCSLECLYCQNSDISQSTWGRELSTQEAAGIMLDLEGRGAENINLVTPTHQPRVFDALGAARSRGLRIPTVYNCSGYEDPEYLRRIEGLVDIYMPDIKYSSDEVGRRLSGVEEYWQWARRSVLEMHRQVGTLTMDARGVGVRGLLVRHLVLPDDTAGSRAIIDFLVDDVSVATSINIMSQYRPAYRARTEPVLRRGVRLAEVDAVIAYARSKGMRNILR